MKCDKCGAELMELSGSSLNRCPFCGTPVCYAEIASGYIQMWRFLQYLVSIYGAELYCDPQRLNKLIMSLYRGNEQLKYVYSRAILNDALPQRIYELSLKPLNERESYYNQIVSQFIKTNSYSTRLGKQITKNLATGLQLKFALSDSTRATDNEGKWEDEFGVIYSADKRKLIKGVDELSDYEIAEGTTILCDRAFWKNKKIVIPSSLTTIGRRAFGRCERIVLKNNDHFKVIDDLLYTADMKMLMWCSILKQGNLYIPDSVIKIDNSSFCWCESLIGIHIPDSVIDIGGYVFYDCKSLTDIHIPNSVTSIGSHAFERCQSLKNVHLPNLLKSIGSSFFRECESLVNVHIPNSVSSIGHHAFNCCFSLKNIHISDSVQIIEEHTFSYCRSLSNIVIPDSVTNIKRSAFKGCSSLTCVDIPNSVISLEDEAFRDCRSLSKISIPNSIINIGKGTFDGCYSLRNIFIPKNATEKFKQLLPKELHSLLKECSEVE